jgi:hypothetical protein
MEAASFAGPPFDRLSEVSSRPFSHKLSEDVGRPFSVTAQRADDDHDASSTKVEGAKLHDDEDPATDPCRGSGGSPLLMSSHAKQERIEPRTPDNDVNIVEFAAKSSDTNALEDEKWMEITLDTGAVAHVAAPHHLPGACRVVQTQASRSKHFIAANGIEMKNEGEADVTLVDDEEGDGKESGCTFNVTNVTRPLHAAAVIADTNKEILIIKGKAVVVPEGTLSKHLKGVKVIQTYARRGNLYVNRVKAKPARGRNRDGSTADFTRQGRKE